MKRTFLSAAAAGIMISIGGCLYVNALLSGAGSDLAWLYKVIGALLFSVGLYAICFFGLALYTGQVGNFFTIQPKSKLSVIWLGNLAGTLIAGLLLRLADPDMAMRASALVESKLACGWAAMAIKAFFCGILMYVAVTNFKKHPDAAGAMGLVFCVSVFILCGFEHSIANMFYFAAGSSAAQIFPAILSVLWVSIFNGLGSVAINWLIHGTLRHE